MPPQEQFDALTDIYLGIFNKYTERVKTSE